MPRHLSWLVCSTTTARHNLLSSLRPYSCALHSLVGPLSPLLFSLPPPALVSLPVLLLVTSPRKSVVVLVSVLVSVLF